MFNLLTLSSHLLFIYLSHTFLMDVIDWKKLAKSSLERPVRLRLLIVFISIALGFLVSTFFLQLLNLGRQMAFEGWSMPF